MTPDESAMAEIDKARSHPMRRRILVAMRELDKPLSPVEFGKFISKETSAVAYHFRVLEKAGLIDLTEEGSKRGAIQHFFVLSPKFKGSIEDCVALDRIADLLDQADELSDVDVKAIARVVFASGRPVIGGDEA